MKSLPSEDPSDEIKVEHPAAAFPASNALIDGQQAGTFTINDINAVPDTAAVRISIADRHNNSVLADGVLNEDGNWGVKTVDLSQLTGNEVDLHIKTLDAFGNESFTVQRLVKAKPPVAKAVLLDKIADDNAINATESKSLFVGGIRVDGEATTVEVSLSDATGMGVKAQAIQGIDGEWSADRIDVSQLTDGALKLVVRTRNVFGNESVTERALTKSTSSPAKAALPAHIVTHNIVNAAASRSFAVRGMSADPLATRVDISLTDQQGNSVEDSAIKDDRGLWNAEGLNLQSLNDGVLKLCVTSYDAYGNTSVTTRSLAKEAKPLEDDSTNVEVPLLGTEDHASHVDLIGVTLMETAARG